MPEPITTIERTALLHVRCYGLGGFPITEHSTGPTLAAALWHLALAGYLGLPAYLEAQGQGDWVGIGDTPLYGTVALTEKGEEALNGDD